jgi:hypothetical protein
VLPRDSGTERGEASVATEVGIRRLPIAAVSDVAFDGFRTAELTDWDVAVFAGPAEPIVESSASARAMHVPQKPAAVAVPIPNATAREPTLPT